MLNTQAWCFSSPTRADVINMWLIALSPMHITFWTFIQRFCESGTWRWSTRWGWGWNAMHVIRSMHQFNAGAGYEAIACLCNAEQNAWEVLRIQRYLHFMFKPVLDRPWPLSVTYWQYFKQTVQKTIQNISFFAAVGIGFQADYGYHLSDLLATAKRKQAVVGYFGLFVD